MSGRDGVRFGLYAIIRATREACLVTVSGRESSRRQICLWGAAVFAVAMLTRTAFDVGGPDSRWPFSVLYEGDAPLWVHFAESLRAGKPFEFNMPIHSPGMALVLAALKVRAGQSFLPIKLGLALIGALNCVLAFALGRLSFGNRIGFAAGMLSAVSFGLLVQSASVNSETPYTFLLLISLLLTQRFAANRSVGWAALLGLAHGLAAMLRAEHTLFFLLSMIYIANRSIRVAGLKRSIPPFFALLGVFILVPVFWSIRSYSAIQRFNTVDTEPMPYARAAVPWRDDARDFIESLPGFARGPNARHIEFQAEQEHRPVIDRAFVDAYFERMGYVPAPLSPYTFISNQGAFSFALANNQFAQGGFSSLLLDEGSERRAATGQVSANDFYFANPRHLNLYEHGYRIGLHYLIQNPGNALRLIGKKLNNFLAGLAGGLTSWNFPLGPSGERLPVDQFVVSWQTISSRPGLLVAWRLFIVVLIGAGLIECAARRTGGLFALVLLYKLLITMAFYGYAREAVSILPVVYILVALGFYRLLPKWAKSSPALRRVTPAMTGLFVVTALTVGIWDASRGWAYQIHGSGDATPQWGPGAFESSQRIEIQRIRPDEKLSNGYRVG